MLQRVQSTKCCLTVMLHVLQQVGDKHGTSISNVASRWVLSRPAVPAIILLQLTQQHLRILLSNFTTAILPCLTLPLLQRRPVYPVVAHA